MAARPSLQVSFVLFSKGSGLASSGSPIAVTRLATQAVKVI